MPPAEEWSFNQPVLLRKAGRASSALIWTAAAGTVGVLLWALVAPLSETIAVQGKLEPGSKVRSIDAPAPGLVDAVLVKEGQAVRQGDPLVRFDLREARSKLAAATAVRDRLRNENQIYRVILGESGSAGLSANQRSQLLERQRALGGRRQGAMDGVRKTEALIGGLRKNLANAQDVAARFRALARTGAMSELQLRDAENKVNQLSAELLAQQAELSRARSSLAETEARPGEELRSKIEANLKELTEVERQISEAQRQLQYGQLSAPIGGVVFDLSVGRGSVVSLAATKPLLKIVPGDDLQARVYIPNNAIGFVRVGQEAQVSLESYRSSDYGRITAKVVRIGSDALTQEEQAKVLGNQSSGLYFPALLSLSRQNLQVGRVSLPLQAGMALTADILVRERRYIQIFTGFFEDKQRSLERLRL